MHIPPSLYSAMRFNFLYVDRYVFHKGWVYPETYVPYCMLRYILKGSAVFTINGVEYQVHENQVAYIPDSCMLECHALGDDFEFISIRFTVTVRLNDNDFLAEFSISRRSPKTPSKRSFPIFRRSTATQPAETPAVCSASGGTWSLSWPGW